MLERPVTRGENKGDNETDPSAGLLQQSMAELAGGDVSRHFEV